MDTLTRENAYELDATDLALNRRERASATKALADSKEYMAKAKAKGDEVMIEHAQHLLEIAQDAFDASMRARQNAKANLIAAQRGIKFAEATCQPAMIEQARLTYIQAREAFDTVQA